MSLSIKWDKSSNSGYTDNTQLIRQLRENNKILAEPIGTPSISRKQNKILGKPFLIYGLDMIYLYEK